MFSFLQNFTCHQLFHLVSISLGKDTVQIPVAEIVGKQPGRTLLVTGGMDGDEYAGMEAGYELAAQFQHGRFAGKLIIIPIVNLPGFIGEISKNPLDGKFLKLAGLGRANGSPTERLVDWLVTNYAVRADCWLDAHGGAITERLRPFVWMYETEVPVLNNLIESLADSLSTETIVYELKKAGTRADYLAPRGCIYLITESGERGERKRGDIERHLDWMKTTMRVLDMLESDCLSRSLKPQRYRKVCYAYAPLTGLWRSEIAQAETLARDQLIGTCQRLDQTNSCEVRFQQSGRLLWWKETMSVKKGEIIAALAFN